MNRIISKFSITYDNGITQVKNLVSQEDFDQIIKPKLKEIYELETKDMKKEANLIKKSLKEMFSSNYFTTESPLYDAYKTGYLDLPLHCGGRKPCHVVELI